MCTLLIRAPSGHKWMVMHFFFPAQQLKVSRRVLRGTFVGSQKNEIDLMFRYIGASFDLCL